MSKVLIASLLLSASFLVQGCGSNLGEEIPPPPPDAGTEATDAHKEWWEPGGSGVWVCGASAFNPILCYATAKDCGDSCEHECYVYPPGSDVCERDRP